jgi:hypothetical protein
VNIPRALLVKDAAGKPLRRSFTRCFQRNHHCFFIEMSTKLPGPAGSADQSGRESFLGFLVKIRIALKTSRNAASATSQGNSDSTGGSARDSRLALTGLRIRCGESIDIIKRF